MTAEQLAEKMHAAWRRALHDPSAHPAWGNLPTEDRGAWVAAGRVAIEWGDGLVQLMTQHREALP